MLGVCYYPEHWPESQWAEDARSMYDCGIRVVRIAEFAWSRYEPTPGQWQFDWLDRAINTLAAEGLQVVMCTPTATPPKWLVDLYPDILPVDEAGRTRRFGSRHHKRYASKDWIRETERIAHIIGERYGAHPAVVGWQLDNEYGCHDSIISYHEEDRDAFQQWLSNRYQSIEALNTAWGNVFWSMEFQHFGEVERPNLTVTEANPAHRLDYWRFFADQVTAYNRLQADIIRSHSPGRWITHNFMGCFHQFDHAAVARDLDFVAWDSYPLGFTNQRLPLSDAERIRWARTGHPDVAAFHHDLYRGISKDPFWVMEQQPGPVNWATDNPSPKDNMVLIWTLEALMHGAGCVSYFRWRQAPFAQEQNHTGLNRVDGSRDQAYIEAKRAHEILTDHKLTEAPCVPADVAILLDDESIAAHDIQPQGSDLGPWGEAFTCYQALRRLGLNVDLIRPDQSDMTGYKLIIVAGIQMLSKATLSALQASHAHVICCARTGSRTTDFHIPDHLPPGVLQDVMSVSVLRAASMPPGWTGRMSSCFDVDLTCHSWRESLKHDADVIAEDDEGPLIVRHGRFSYLGCRLTIESWIDLLEWYGQQASLETTRLPEHLRIRRRGALTMTIDYDSATFTLEQT